MRKCAIAMAAILCVGGVALADAPSPATQPTTQEANVPGVLDFTMKSLAGNDVNLSQYLGKVVLIVNTASKCGFTPQYGPLEKLHEKYAGQGLAILGFPENDFHHQEPGTDAEISQFCTTKYGVKFDMFSKIDVIGPNICPLYKYLTSADTDKEFAGPVKWNFEKFLISRDGKIVGRWRSKVKPDSPEMVSAIEAELAK